jgi:hypothetical protein
MLVWQSVMDDASKLPAVKLEFKFRPRGGKKVQMSSFLLSSCLRFLGDDIAFALYCQF